MSEREQRAASEPQGERDEPDLVAGVTAVVDAALGVGASLAKVFAEATAASRPVAPPASHAPLDAMIHYGLATVTNVAERVTSGVSGLGAAFGRSAGGPAPPASGHAAAAGPRIHAGATLRVPLSIENPGDAPMTGVVFRCASLRYLGGGAGAPLGPEAVRFHPALLEILPRDFEKLTVFVDTRADTALGRYCATIECGGSALRTPLEFDVVAAEPATAA